VQTYELEGVEIWHVDLYRLTDPDECWELGLDAAFETAICLIEWPARLGFTPPGAIEMTLSHTNDGQSRSAHLSAPDGIWDSHVEQINKSWGAL